MRSPGNTTCAQSSAQQKSQLSKKFVNVEDAAAMQILFSAATKDKVEPPGFDELGQPRLAFAIAVLVRGFSGFLSTGGLSFHLRVRTG